MRDIIEEIQTIDKKKLLDKETVISLMENYGLHDDPNINYKYGKQRQKYLVPDGMLQIPEQLADALIFLSDKHISSYVEIGTFNGRTTTLIVAYLCRFGLEKAITIDKFRRFDNSYHLPIASVVGTSFYFDEMKSDLCFIDGDHSFNGVSQDYSFLGQFSRYCMFHDICEETMDVQDFWNRLKRKTSQEFTQGGTMGIGIL